MAPRKKLTLSDLKPAMAEAAAKPTPAPEPTRPALADLTIKPTAPPAGLVPVDPREIEPSAVLTRSPRCAAPRAHDGCLFGGDPMPACVAPSRVHRQCPHGGNR